MQIAIPERVIERAIQQKYFNVTASANFLGVSPSTFRIWLKKFDFKPISIDGQILYDKDVLQKFMEDHKLWVNGLTTRSTNSWGLISQYVKQKYLR